MATCSQEVVRIGDVLALADLEAGGYVIGDDVVSESLFVSHEASFLPSLAPNQLEMAQFVVTPRFQYTAHGQLAELVQRLPALSGAATASFFEISTATWGETMERIESHVESLQSREKEELLDPLSIELRKRLCAYHDECKTNEMDFKRIIGRPVVYGNVIQLRHSRTGKFITCTKRRAEANSGAMRITLVGHGNKGSWLRVVPAECVHTEGDAIHYCDQIKLGSLKFANIFLSTFQPSDFSGAPMSPSRHTMKSTYRDNSSSGPWNDRTQPQVLNFLALLVQKYK